MRTEHPQPGQGDSTPPPSPPPPSPPPRAARAGIGLWTCRVTVLHLTLSAAILCSGLLPLPPGGPVWNLALFPCSLLLRLTVVDDLLWELGPSAALLGGLLANSLLWGFGAACLLVALRQPARPRRRRS